MIKMIEEVETIGDAGGRPMAMLCQRYKGLYRVPRWMARHRSPGTKGPRGLATLSRRTEPKFGLDCSFMVACRFRDSLPLPAVITSMRARFVAATVNETSFRRQRIGAAD